MSTASGAQIKQKRNQLGWSQQRLATAVGSHPQTIDKIERGAIKFSRYLLPIQQALGIIAAAEGVSGGPVVTRDFQSAELIATQDRTAALPCFFGNADESEEYAMVLRAEPTTLIPRPIRLHDFEEAYAVVVAITAMEPAYEVGDTLYVNPYLPPEPGKDVLLRRELDGGGAMVIVGRLVEITRDGWRVRQHGRLQKKDFSVSKKEYPKCHRIIGTINR